MGWTEQRPWQEALRYFIACESPFEKRDIGIVDHALAVWSLHRNNAR